MSRLPELTAKVDAFFARVSERHAADLECNSGCADCCVTRLTITGVEADAIRDELATWAPVRRAALAAMLAAETAAAATTAPTRCAALGPDDRCAIYVARPLVCRSHGAPIRMRDPRGLPVVEACARNFTARRGGPSDADADCILDQTTLSAMLLAVDREYAAGAVVERIDLAALLRAIVSC